MLQTENTLLVIIDIQDRLLSSMDGRDRLLINLQKMIKSAIIFKIPIILTEQVPEKLGVTNSGIMNLLQGIQPIVKNSFSCCGCGQFLTTLESKERKQILLTGIEAHVCVYQTAVELFEKGYDVYILNDAISSRFPTDLKVATDRMRDIGINIVGVEMVIFELLRVAQGDIFKKIIQIVK
jgi:nicotinamidase-related amidase